ncbi:hypothetical protein M3P05_11590 [Sansalvadorimonas sp. 2012CJ34-2]|uniref:Uncharacterized protein n=1 Tax=Parendozoicomonas callyspongiae TaxID=2942213 RepID=A0ABT0PHT7_9GAMM|nr:hypothetical protein [Sansalvadorimonas sp. 2012CJ34-2]MCL6270566.1 hypothetical protein [Sansalvadorimonas sp. 2012CJ34-2]
MSIQTGGPQSAQQIQQDRTLKGQDQPMSGQKMMKKTIKLINSAAGAPMNQNFIDKTSLDALMLAIMSERAELLEETLREQVQEVRSKNNKLKNANQIMAKARAAKKGSKEEEDTEMPQEVKDFFAKNDIPWGDGGKKINPNETYKLNSGEWDLAIENMKGWTESLTSTSQLDMTKLQSTSGKFNQTFEMMSQFISKYYRSGDNIIKNI